MSDPLSIIPEITDQDIEWVCELMQLDPLDEPRRAFLAARNTLDVSACPGSGKTTLVVAKLAILAKKWHHRTKGICVLSHTNVAREEIQHRLGNTVIGQRLLGYPHFIDTIHSFVNRFLALPWLNSNGYPSPTIDDEVTTAYRRSVIGNKYHTVQAALSMRGSSFNDLRICARDLSFDLGGRPLPFGSGSESFKQAKQAIEAAAKAGYFCYDEMFVWALSLLNDSPNVASWLRHRFPLIILDEMQDTFEIQGKMLHLIFPRTSPEIVVQRVGDPNQAIFDNSDAKPNESDLFPDVVPTRNLSIPNSYRFGPEIAALALPFAITPVGVSGLCGIGPKTIKSTLCKHTIFIFPENSTEGVLDAYGRYVLRTFSDDALEKSKVTAVGAVHQDIPTEITPEHPHFPKSVPHYWSGYAAESARKEPHPKAFLQYIRIAQAVIQPGHDLSPSIEKVASGFIRLASYIGNISHIGRRIRTHRTIVDALQITNPEVLKIYQRLLKTFLIDRMLLTEQNWLQMQTDIMAVACAICEGETNVTNAANFLIWVAATPPLVVSGASTSQRDVGLNMYRVLDGGRYVDIQLGSIHSVKGQTHLATLVLNTYWNAHSSERILPWLLGDKINENGAGIQDRKRLLQTYVAMTRPSHMICLAMRRSAFGDATVFRQHIAVLKERGWQVAEIITGSPVWHS